MQHRFDWSPRMPHRERNVNREDLTKIATRLRRKAVRAMLQEKKRKRRRSRKTRNLRANESEVDLLKQAEVIIAQQKAAATTLTDLEANEAKRKSQLGELADNQLAEEPPYSVMLVDQLRDSVKSLKEMRVDAGVVYDGS